MLKRMARAFRTPDSLTLAAQGLAESRRQLLASEEAESYARAMCTHHRDTIQRLERLLQDHNKPSTEVCMKK